MFREPVNVYNGVELRVDSSFGCSSEKIDKNGLFISEDSQSIIYPSGGHLARYDLITGNKEYVARMESHKTKITAMGTGLTKNRDVVVAIAEKDYNLELSPKVTIFF